MIENIGDVSLKDNALGYVDEIRKSKNKMDTIFNTFNENVNQLKSSGGFESSSGREFYNRYAQLKSHYDDFLRMFEEFAKDYEMAIENAQMADTTVKSAAQEIKNTLK